VNRVRLRADVPDGFDGVYLFGSLGDSSREILISFAVVREFDRGFPVTSFGGFVQDHWSLARQLTVDLGVRYDFERLPAGFNQDTNNVSPRIGLAWSPSPKWVFRAGYGVFFRSLRSRQFDATHREKRSQAFEQVMDGNAAAAFFAAAQGGPLVRLHSELPHLSSDLIRAWRLPIASRPVRCEYLLAKNLTLRADYLFCSWCQTASNAKRQFVASGCPDACERR